MRDVERQIAGMRFGYSGPQARRFVVIPGTSATDEAITQSRDDLAVMTTILNRAANPEKGRRPDLVNGFNDWHGGGGRDLDALLIDGFGAVFLLDVDYPLVATAAEDDKPAEPKNTRDNTWEKTRREVLGQPDLEDDREAEEGPGRAERMFDATRVNELEQRLKESLRHAGNLRGLTTEDWIIVQVMGPQSRPAPGLRSGARSERSQVAHPNRRGGGGSSVLTLRIRKSAVDRLAAEPAELEEFVREVKVSRRLEKASRAGQ